MFFVFFFDVKQFVLISLSTNYTQKKVRCSSHILGSLCTHSTKNFTFNCKIYLIIFTLDGKIFLLKAPLYYIYQQNISHTTFINDRQKKSVPAKILQKRAGGRLFLFTSFLFQIKTRHDSHIFFLQNVKEKKLFWALGCRRHILFLGSFLL